jgi:hypothetical protein
VVPENSVEIEIIRLVGVGFAPFLGLIGGIRPHTLPSQKFHPNRPKAMALTN